MDTHFLSEYMKLLIPATNCNPEEHIRVHECLLRPENAEAPSLSGQGKWSYPVAVILGGRWQVASDEDPGQPCRSSNLSCSCHFLCTHLGNRPVVSILPEDWSQRRTLSQSLGQVHLCMKGLSICGAGGQAWAWLKAIRWLHRQNNLEKTILNCSSSGAGPICNHLCFVLHYNFICLLILFETATLVSQASLQLSVWLRMTLDFLIPLSHLVLFPYLILTSVHTVLNFIVTSSDKVVCVDFFHLRPSLRVPLCCLLTLFSISPSPMFYCSPCFLLSPISFLVS